MTRPDWIETLRADVRPVDPDPVLLAQLVELSSRSVAPAPRLGRSAGARLAMVLGGVIAVGATSWAAGALPGTDSPFRPEESVTQQPTDPTPSRSPGAPPGEGRTPSGTGTPASPGETPADPSSGSDSPAEPESGATPTDPSTTPGTTPGRGSSPGPPTDLPTLPQLPVTPSIPASPDPPGLERFPEDPSADPLQKSDQRTPGDDDDDADAEDQAADDNVNDSDASDDSDSGSGRSPHPQEVLVDRAR